jgi:Melibiase
MKKSVRIFGVSVLGICLAGALNGMAQQAEGVWDAGSQTVALSVPGGKPWLVEGVVQIKLSDGTLFSSRDPRFQVTVVRTFDKQVLMGVDTQKKLDWELVITSLGPDAVRLDMRIFNRGLQPLKLDRIDLLSGRLTGAVKPSENRALVSTLHSWAGGHVKRLTPESKIESYYTVALQSPALAAGFLAGRHNLNRFLLTPITNGITFVAYGECNNCLLMPGALRATDPLFISAGGHPLDQMEKFADLAARENGVQLWPENFATWCSWYAGWMRQESLYNFKQGLERGVEDNIPLIAESLGTRGTPSMRVVDDSNEMPYGDWDNRTLCMPNGFQSSADQIKSAGIMAGVWYPPFWVSTKSRLYQEHPELMCRTEDGQVALGKKAGIPEFMYGNQLGFLDASNPSAAAKMEATARSWRDRGFRYVMTDFMYWGAWGQKRFDPTMTGVETYVAGLEAMRKGYGVDTYWLHCGALLGPAMGLCDGMRISGDSHGGEMFSYESAGARWFYNWRVWLNDPDAIVCRRYGEEKGVVWSRAWMSWMALAGNVLTYGDTFDDLPEQYLELYKKVLPPLPKAGHPLDLWENDPFLVWGMDPGIADGAYTIFGIFEFQGKQKGEKLVLNLDEISSRSRSWSQTPKEAPGSWLLWDFWNQSLTRVTGAKITLPVPEKDCKVFACRPDLGRPQLLSTSGHFSQGVLETREIIWNAKAKSLVGKARGNGGDPTTLFFHLPEGMACSKALVAYGPVEVKAVSPGVIAIEIPVAQTDPVVFELSFTGQPVNVPNRPFTAGLVAEVSKSE